MNTNPLAIPALAGALCLLAGSACSSGGDGTTAQAVTTDPLRQILVDCTAVGVQRIVQTTRVLADVVIQANDPATPFPQIQLRIPPGTFAVLFDANRDGLIETVIDGTIRRPFSQLFNRIQPGESFTIDLETGGAFGMIGSLTYRLSDDTGPARYEVSGAVEISRGVPCQFSSARIDLDYPIAGGVAGEPLGVIEVEAITGSNRLAGLATLAPGADVQVDALDLQGNLLFFLDPVTFSPFALR